MSNVRKDGGDDRLVEPLLLEYVADLVELVHQAKRSPSASASPRCRGSDAESDAVNECLQLGATFFCLTSALPNEKIANVKMIKNDILISVTFYKRKLALILPN
jgi:hypothetical protein